MTTTRFTAAWVQVLFVGLATIGFAACDDSGSSASKPSSTSTTRQAKPRPTTTSSSTALTTSTSTTGLPTSTTTAPPVPNPPDSPTPSNCGTRAGAIYAAVQGGDLGPVPLASYAITDCRVATSNQIWAAVTLQPNPGTSVIPLTVALQRLGSIWTVSSYGPDHIACDAPAPVPTELRLGC